MLKEKHKEAKLFYNFNMEQFIPEDHFLRSVDHHIDFSFIRDRVRHLYSHTGKPAIDPVVLIKLLLIGYFYNIKSERQIEKELQVNLAYRWFINYDIDEQIPDHSTISQTRRRKFTDSTIFQEIFDEIVMQCIKKGLIKGETILTDSTHIKANASYDSLVEVVITPGEFIKNLDANSEFEENVSVENATHKYSNHTHRSKTDPDSRLMGRINKPSGLHYLEHRSIDDSGFITDVHITPANIQDNLPYIDRIRRQKRTFNFPIRRAVADKAYGIGIVYKELTEMSIDAIIPQYTRQDKKEGIFDHDDYVYMKDEDCYVCPAGGKLFKRSDKAKDGKAYEYAGRMKYCNKDCSLRTKCTTSLRNKPKIIKRSIHQEYIDIQLMNYGSPEWKKYMSIRRTLLEGSFANAKYNHGLGRAKRRGLKNVQEQSLLTAVAQNIKKMIKIMTHNECEDIFNEDICITEIFLNFSMA